MTGEQFEKTVRPLIAALYPGYASKDYALMASKCRAVFEEWARASYTGARKARNVKVANVPNKPPHYVMRLSFETMGRVKVTDLGWDDTRAKAAPAAESPAQPAESPTTAALRAAVERNESQP